MAQLPVQTITSPVPRRLRDRSKYNPHQAIREQMRRVGQMLAGKLGEAKDLAEVVSPETQTLYIDYATAKAAGQDLSRFSPPIVVDVQPPDAFEIKYLDDELVDPPIQTIGYVDAVPQAGPSPAEG